MVESAAPGMNFVTRYRKVLLGGLAVALFLVFWQAIFLVVPYNPLFISKPSAIAEGFVDLIESGDLLHDLADGGGLGLKPPSWSACRSASSWDGASASARRSIR